MSLTYKVSSRNTGVNQYADVCAGMPEMEDLFLRYKELKKHLKAMKKAQPEIQAVAAAHDDDQQEEASTSGNQVKLLFQLQCRYMQAILLTSGV